MRAAASLLILALIIIALWFGKNFLIPLVIAVLMTTLIAATTDRLARIGLPSSLALVVSILLFLLSVAGVGYILSGQAGAVTAAWPRYVERLTQLTQQWGEWIGPAASGQIRSLVAEWDLAASAPRVLGTAGDFVGALILVLLYVGFMLAERRTFSDKVRRIFPGSSQSAAAQQTLGAIMQGIRDYIWIKTLMSLLTGLVSYAVLRWLGLDFAETWALLIFLLNYIPSIGSILGVVFPALLALVQFDALWPFLVIAVFLSAAQFLIGNVLEPAVMGNTLNLSPLVVLVSLAFWGSIWGVVGAVLSVPLTAAIVIACSKLPNWRWLAVLLSNDGRISEDEVRG